MIIRHHFVGQVLVSWNRGSFCIDVSQVLFRLHMFDINQLFLQNISDEERFIEMCFDL